MTPIAQAVQAYARHLAWSPNDVEDIFQTALLNAYRKFGEYEEGTHFKAWLLRFVTYAAFDPNFGFKFVNRSYGGREARWVQASWIGGSDDSWATGAAEQPRCVGRFGWRLDDESA